MTKPIQIAVASNYILIVLFDDGSIKKIHTGTTTTSDHFETIYQPQEDTPM